jgi:hypothetical protein
MELEKRNIEVLDDEMIKVWRKRCIELKVISYISGSLYCVTSFLAAFLS